MKGLDLDVLLGDRFPEASFHDSELIDFSINYSAATAEFQFRILIASEKSIYSYEPGTLQMRGLLFVSIEPPRVLSDESKLSPLWITDDGPFPDERLRVTIDLPPSLLDSCYCHYLYSSDTNSFIVIAAEAFSFVWASR